MIACSSLFCLAIAYILCIYQSTGFPPNISSPSQPPPDENLDNQTVDIGLEVICISEGASVTLFCDSPVGSPPINYFWISGNSMSSDPIQQGPTLTVMDAGVYTCVANNAYGQDNATSEVICKHTVDLIHVLSKCV